MVTTASMLRTRDGRLLSYEEYGDPNGKPVFCLHGTPGSRVGPWPRSMRLHPQGIRLISYDRPGYGESDRLAGRTVANAASDVEDLADELRIQRFAVVGRSGGAPHALACATLLPDRVSRVAALVSPAPRDLMGEAWYDGMAERNTEWYKVAELGLAVYTEYVAESMNRSRDDLASFMPYAHPTLPKADRAAVADYGIRSRLWDNFAEALRNGIDGWIDDNLAIVSPWEFDLAKLGVPVLLWHGTEDTSSPVAHSKWLCRVIPNAQLHLQHGKAHFSAVEDALRILRWAALELDCV